MVACYHPKLRVCIKIYCAYNRVTGKCYVGKTTGSFRRQREHFCTYDRTPFHQAAQKYGKSAFIFSVIGIAWTNQTADKCERFWIEFLGTKVPGGYNLTDGGEGLSPGYRFSTEVRKARSEFTKGRKHTAQARANMSTAQRSKPKPAGDVLLRFIQNARHQSEQNIGQIWVNNGLVSLWVKPGATPAGFIRGRLSRTKSRAA